MPVLGGKLNIKTPVYKFTAGKAVEMVEGGVREGGLVAPMVMCSPSRTPPPQMHNTFNCLAHVQTRSSDWHIMARFNIIKHMMILFPLHPRFAP